MKKRRYEKPQAQLLDRSLAVSMGGCSVGNTPGACGTGYDAGTCNDGSNEGAGTVCSTGSAAQGGCSTGNNAD